MSGTFVLGADRAYGIIGTDEVAVVTNGNTTGTVYIGKGPSTSVGSNDFSIAAGASRVVQGPAYAIGSTNVTISTRNIPVEERAPSPVVRIFTGDTPNDDAAGSGSQGGTSTAHTAALAHVCEIAILQRTTLTGIGYLLGATGGTDKVIAVLYDYRGNVLANSAIAGTTAGTANTYQELAFTAPYEVFASGRYFVGIAANGTTATLQKSDGTVGQAGDVTIIAGTAAAAWTAGSAPTNITVPTAVATFPVAYTY